MEKESSSTCETIELPSLTLEALKACSFENWYHDFSQFTFPSTIISLHQSFLDYLQDHDHGLHLPIDLEPLSSYTSQLSDSDDEPNTDELSSLGSQSEPVRYAFPELTQTITRTIASYDGSVFPKLNWSAPQDANFLLVSGDGPLRCRSAADVYMLLKSSTCVYHDLDLLRQIAYHSPSQPLSAVLVLREWFNLNPANEFRCFVRARRLLAISSRSSTYFEFLVPELVQRSIVDRISDFFKHIILPRFDRSDFIFDVYLKNPTKVYRSSTGSTSKSKPNLKLTDINPFASYIDPCLYSYDELETISQESISGQSDRIPPLRIVMSNDQDGFGCKFDFAKMPSDFLDFSKGQEINELNEKWQKLRLTNELGNQDS